MFPCNPPQSSTKTATHIHTIHIVIKDQARVFSLLREFNFVWTNCKQTPVYLWFWASGWGRRCGWGFTRISASKTGTPPLLLFQVACRLLLCMSVVPKRRESGGSVSWFISGSNIHLDRHWWRPTGCGKEGGNEDRVAAEEKKKEEGENFINQERNNF